MPLVRNVTTKLSDPGPGLVWNGRLAEGECGGCGRKLFKDNIGGWQLEDRNEPHKCRGKFIEVQPAQDVPEDKLKVMAACGTSLALDRQTAKQISRITMADIGLLARAYIALRHELKETKV